MLHCFFSDLSSVALLDPHTMGRRKIIWNTNISKRSAEKPYDCPSCDGCFKNRIGLENHIRSLHTRRCICLVCEQAFDSLDVFCSHLSSHDIVTKTEIEVSRNPVHDDDVSALADTREASTSKNRRDSQSTECSDDIEAISSSTPLVGAGPETAGAATVVESVRFPDQNASHVDCASTQIDMDLPASVDVNGGPEHADAEALSATVSEQEPDQLDKG